MPTVKISNEHDQIIKRQQNLHEEDHGIRPDKKQLVENAIAGQYAEEGDPKDE